MNDAVISLFAALAILLAFDLAAARLGIDSRWGSDPRRDWSDPTWPIR